MREAVSTGGVLKDKSLIIVGKRVLSDLTFSWQLLSMHVDELLSDGVGKKYLVLIPAFITPTLSGLHCEKYQVIS